MPLPLGGLREALRYLIGCERLRIVETGGDVHGRDREQWDDANNMLARRPGTVIGYDRNVATNELVARAGLEVRRSPERNWAEGGVVCLSCPVLRGAPGAGREKGEDNPKAGYRGADDPS